MGRSRHPTPPHSARQLLGLRSERKRTRRRWSRSPCGSRVVLVLDVEVARAVHCHAHRAEQFRAGGRAIVPAITGGAFPRHGGDDAARVHLADAVAVSAMYRLPALSTATPLGDRVPRWWPAVVVPYNPRVPLPATVVMMPLDYLADAVVATYPRCRGCRRRPPPSRGIVEFRAGGRARCPRYSPEYRCPPRW